MTSISVCNSIEPYKTFRSVEAIRQWHGKMLSDAKTGLVDFHERERNAHGALSLLLTQFDRHTEALRGTLDFSIQLVARDRDVLFQSEEVDGRIADAQMQEELNQLDEWLIFARKAQGLLCASSADGT